MGQEVRQSARGVGQPHSRLRAGPSVELACHGAQATSRSKGWLGAGDDLLIRPILPARRGIVVFVEILDKIEGMPLSSSPSQAGPGCCLDQS